jgi:hypothetical protein
LHARYESLRVGAHGPGALTFVATLGELLDDLGAERRQIVGLAARYETLVHDDLLVDPASRSV